GEGADGASRGERRSARLRSQGLLAPDGYAAGSQLPRKRVVAGQRQVENLVIDPQFWSGRRVYLTGHTGFKGAWAALMLWRLGAKVTGFALPAAGDDDLFEIADVAPVLDKHELGDIRNLASLTASLQAAEPEIVLHLAAQSLVRLSYD